MGTLHAGAVLLALVGIAPGHDDATPRPSLMRSAEKAVFAHMMVSYGTKAFSGAWRGWNYSNKRVRHDPDAVDTGGRRDIASVYHPTIGPYDMTDPDLVEYHCQLMKMAGFDGMMFDLSFYHRAESRWRVESMRLYAKTMARYGLKAVVVYEDKCHWIWNRGITTRQAAVRAAYADMTAWLKVFEPVQYRIDDRPLLMFFSYQHQVEGKGESRLSPEELREWRNRFPEGRRPVLMAQWFQPRYGGILNGNYDWPRIEGTPPTGSPFKTFTDFAAAKRLQTQREQQARHWLNSRRTDFHITGAWPGFDDRGCWGWGDGPRFIPRLDGTMYRYQWERAIQSGSPIVQIATWNDWFEGTNIEPAQEFGTRYLEITREYAARFKGEGVPVGDLRLPIWVYRIRKGIRDKLATRSAQHAAELIRVGQYEKAAAAIDPWRPLVPATRPGR